MKCESIKIDIQEYADGQLSNDRTAVLDLHLDSCPLCRNELDLIRSLKNDLSSLRRSDIRLGALNQIRYAVNSEFTLTSDGPVFRLIEGNGNWLKRWMWPTTVGTVTSLVFGLFLLAVIMIPADVPQLAISLEEKNIADESLFFARSGQLADQLITPEQFANSRSDFSRESPSLNPAGTLVDIAQSESHDDEAVVVADIYGNGSAQITNVVETSKDRKMMDRLMAAFQPDRSAPPFVPASMDNRGNVVRVVLKFQNVSVNIEEASIVR